MDLAHKHGRKVALIGRSIDNSTEIAQDLGYIDPPAGLIIHPNQIKDTPANKLCILISGTQGEPMSALSRAAVDNHRFAKIERGDTVLLSSRVIPGNEKAIYRVIDHLERRDARVIHDDGTHGLIHVSGHGSQEELRMMINLVRPKFFIPVHGDYRHLKRHAELAAATGVPEKVILLEDGDVLTLDREHAEKTGKVTTGRVCIDNNSTADVVEDTVIRDRKHLGEDGVFLPIIAINKRTGQVEGAARDHHPRLRRRRPRTPPQRARHRRPHPRAIQRRRAPRLRRHEGQDPRRPQAFPPKERQPPPPHHAHHPRALTRQPGAPFMTAHVIVGIARRAMPQFCQAPQNPR